MNYPKVFPHVVAGFALASLCFAQGPGEPVNCNKTCSAEGIVNVPSLEWTVSFTSVTDGAGTEVCETCEECKGTLTYFFWPSNPNRRWEIDNDPGIVGVPPSPQFGTGMTWGSISMSSSCDDGYVSHVSGFVLPAGGGANLAFEAYLYCSC